MAEGWIKLDRQLQNHWLWKQYPFSYGQAWVDLIMLANHEDTKIPYKGQMIICEKGTVNRSISSLAERWKWSRDKTRNFLRLLEADNMCVVNATKNRTTITLVNWDKFQVLLATNYTTNSSTDKATSRQRADINKNDKNDNNSLLDIVGYLNERAGKSFKATSAKTKSVINARLKEGFTVEDFRAVIDKKCDEWLGDPKMEQYLRPETLFGTKFEGYLQQKGSSNGRSKNDMGKTNGYNPGKAEGLPDCLSWM